MALDASTSLQFVFASLLKRLKKKGYKNQHPSFSFVVSMEFLTKNLPLRKQIYSQNSNRPFEVSLICPSNCEKTIQDSIISKRERKRPKKRRGSQTQQVNSAASALTHSAASGFWV
jgi:hypothetical protein